MPPESPVPEMRPVVTLPTEREISARLDEALDRLGARCIWRPEVSMLCWTHSIRAQADRLRIDRVLELEGRLLGIEVKAPPAQQADLGRDLLQCAQYAVGIVAPNRAEVPATWIGRSLEAVFLATALTGCHEGIIDHWRCAHRLFGPANVGFVCRTRDDALSLRLCGERFWCERYGYHQGMLKRTARVGNGRFVPAAMTAGVAG